MKDRNGKKGLYVLLGTIGMIFLLPNAITCLYVIINGESVKDVVGVEALSAVSLMLTVWACLNIFNYVDKKEYEKLKESVKYDVEQMKKEHLSLQSQVESLINQNNNRLNSISSSVNRNYREQFLSALLYTENDVMSGYFYGEYCELNDDAIPYDRLLSIENTFAQVYTLYCNGDKNRRVPNKVDQILPEIERLIPQINDKTTQGYLQFRKAEFKFYDGSTDNNNAIGSRKMLDAEKYYLLSSDTLGIFLINYEDSISNITYSGDSKKKYISAYYANTLGEIHRKVYEVGKESDQLEVALFYYQCCTSWLETSYAREVYYRNYGVLLEKSQEPFEKAKEQYKKAMATGQISKNLMHCLLSISDKIINQTLSIQSISPDKERTPKLSSTEFIKQVKTLSEDKMNCVNNELSELRINSSIAINLFSDNPDGYLYSAIYYRDLYIVDDHDSKDITHLDEAERMILTALVLNANNPLARIVKRDIDDMRTQNDDNGVLEEGETDE